MTFFKINRIYFWYLKSQWRGLNQKLFIYSIKREGSLNTRWTLYGSHESVGLKWFPGVQKYRRQSGVLGDNYYPSEWLDRALVFTISSLESPPNRGYISVHTRTPLQHFLTPRQYVSIYSGAGGVESDVSQLPWHRGAVRLEDNTHFPVLLIFLLNFAWSLKWS